MWMNDLIPCLHRNTCFLILPCISRSGNSLKEQYYSSVQCTLHLYIPSYTALLQSPNRHHKQEKKIVLHSIELAVKLWTIVNFVVPVGRCHSIDGTLPEGLWSAHEIIFSCHIYLKVVFHSEQSATIHNVERLQKYKNDIMDLQDFTVLTDMVQNA